MRILHLVSYSLYSGPLPSTLRLACAQRRLGHDVWLAHDTKRGGFSPFEESADPHIEAASIAPPQKMTLSAKSSPIAIWRDVRTLKNLLKQDVDVLHVHLSHDHSLASFAIRSGFSGVRIRTIHADRSLENRFGQKKLNQRADGWIVRSDDHRQRLHEQIGVAQKDIAMIPGCIDTELFQPCSQEARTRARAKFKIPEHAQVIGHTALMAGRGQEELLDAAKLVNHPDLHLLFVGRGKDEEEVKAKASASGISERIHFTGYLQGDELLEGYAAMDGAFSAQAGNDASVRAVLEAMSCGLPVVGVGDAAIGEAISSEVGFAVASRAPQDIAQGLQSFLKRNPDVGKNARKKMQTERSIALEAQKTISYYENRLATKS